MKKPQSNNIAQRIELQPKEMRLLELMNGPASLIGFGGSRGGAKSHGLRSVAILRRLQNPGTNALIFRRTYDQLWQSHIQPLAHEWPELFRQYWSAENKALMLPGNSTVLFRYADTLKDILEFKGKEYGDVFIDEATDLPEEEIKIVFTCCRSTVAGFRPKKVLSFNPGGVGHAYVKRVFINKDLTPEERKQGAEFIQSFAWDNVLWVRDALAEDGVPIPRWYTWPQERQIKYLIERSDYGRELNALPPHLRKAWLYGDFDTFAGQVFSEWRRDIHVHKPFAIPKHWRIIQSNDPGFAEMGAFYWLAINEEGRVFCYREATFHRVPYSEQAKQCAKMEQGEQIDFRVSGMDAFVSDGKSGKSIIDYYEEGGLRGWRQPIHGAGSRGQRVGITHEYLKPYEGPDGKTIATLSVAEACTKLIETLPSLTHDPAHPEEVKKCSIDHPWDALSYGLAAWHAKASDGAPVVIDKQSMGFVLGHESIVGAPDSDQSPYDV